MQHPKPGSTLTYAEFVAYAETHEGRFEYVDGRIVDKGIPSDAHQDLSFELAKRIDAHLAGSPCFVRQASAIRTGKNDKSPQRCPDLHVVCEDGPAKLVCEIMSPNRGEDLGEKLTEYRAMREFAEYLVIDSVKRFVRVYRRSPDGNFNYDLDLIGGSVRLDSIEYTLDTDALYRDARINIEPQL